MDTSRRLHSIYSVLYFGDSLTAGSEMPIDQKRFVWPKLVEEISGGTFQAINEGLGGRTTNSVFNFKKALKDHSGAIDILVIALGGNDARDISGNCVPNAVKNIGEMISSAREVIPHAPILIAGPANIRKDTLGITKPIAGPRDQNLRDLTSAYAALARDTGCHFGVIPPESLALDGVHPDAEGNRAVAAKMAAALTDLVWR
jgi:acyl-CoA thioesterase-1